MILPALNAVERASAEAITRANRRIYDALAEPLADAHRRRLDDLLKRRDNGKTTWLAGCASLGQAKFAAYAGTHRTPQGMAGTRSAYRHRAAGSPEPPAQDCPRGRPDDTRRPWPNSSRNGATPLVALATEGMATVTDEIIDLHDRILGKLFNAAKNKHQQQFQASGKAINAKVRLYGASVRR
ncbi:hypothetical protein ABG092_01100 (plasmid) [Klebsiella pneumoniae subsp. pneumoniae]